MKIIFNFTAAPVTTAMFKKGVIDLPQFVKEELRKIDVSVTDGKNNKENGTRLALGLLKDSAPSGAEVAILIPETITYAEWMLVTNAAGKLGILVYIDSEL